MLSCGRVNRGEEEAGPGHPQLRGGRKELTVYPKSNKMLTHLQQEGDLVQFLLLFMSGLLGYNLHW